MSKNIENSQQGFSLIECMIAMVITTIGLLSVAGLIGVGIRLQTESRDAIIATSYARAKIEELQNYAPTAAQRAAGGSVTTNVTNYNDSFDSKFRRRWLIEHSPTNGVPSDAQRITVSVIPLHTDVRLPPVELRVLVRAQ